MYQITRGTTVNLAVDPTLTTLGGIAFYYNIIKVYSAIHNSDLVSFAC